MAVTWNYENAAHLLRRAAFGGTPAEIQAFLARHSSVQSAVDELLSFKPLKAKPPASNNVDDDTRLMMQRWWLGRMVNAAKPADACREKLTLFWHNHLASGQSKQPTSRYMSIQNGLFRFQARGNFKTLIRDTNRDPANLYYIDGIFNRASDDGINVTANENFSRELMELHTLGIFQFKADGSPDPTKQNYTEDDVHHLARALSGWTSIKGTVGVWNQSDWDNGTTYDDNDDEQVNAADNKVIFGVTNNNFGIDALRADTPSDVLQLIFSRTDYEGQNTVGVFLSRKLWTWYAYPAPAPGLKAVFNGFAAGFDVGNFEIKPLLQAMWTHDEFYSTRAKSRTVKNPVDYIVQALQAFGVRSNGKYVGDGGTELGLRAQDMGMNLFEPPSVAGWPGGLAWVNTTALLTRAGFAKDLAAATQGAAIKLTTIPGLIGSATANPGAVVDAILAQLGLNAATVGSVPASSPVPLTAAQRTLLIDYVTNSGSKPTLDLSTDKTEDAVVKVRGLISLALQAAEQQVF